MSLSETAAARGPYRVVRDGDTVLIDGIQGFGPGQYASSVHGCQAVLCQALGIPLNYEDLICYGALAFRVVAHEAMCPSAGHPCCGFMCLDNSNRAVHWNTRFIMSFPGGQPMADRAAYEADACSAIRECIDRGVPVHYGSEEDGLIIGYADGGKRWRCLHPYHQGGQEPFWFDQASGFAGGKWPWCLAIYTGPKDPAQRPAPRELTAAAFKQALEMWSAGKRQAYFVGESAYDHWLTWLHDVNAGKAQDPAGGMQGNGWMFDTLIQYRRAAANWLPRIAVGLPAAAREPLARAAERYAQLVAVCTKNLKCPWDLAMGPGRFAEWTPAMRNDQISRLEQAREHDRRAMDFLSEALARI